ncbi:MAG TPA: DUF481 domain-containing protein [Kofleriaceae bacterium]|nr:DUF481 domain-containing protein [Kofleriaceae bacterium]
MRRSLIAVILLTGRFAAADDPKFEYGKHDDVKDVKGVDWTAAAEAGVVLTTGNSELTTATGGLHLSRKTGANRLMFDASGAYAKSGLRVLQDMNGNGMIDNANEIVTVSTITAETLSSKLRYDRFLTDFNSVYVAALASRDTPAGLESAFGGQAGYSRRLYKSATAETALEVGYDFSRQDPVSGPSLSIHSGRAFIGHKAIMTEGATLEAAMEVLTNLNRENLTTTDDQGHIVDGGPFKDTRVNSRVAITAKIGFNLAVQMSMEVKYDNRPSALPVKNLAPNFQPEASAFDTVMKASFIYTFVGAKKPDKK